MIHQIQTNKDQVLNNCKTEKLQKQMLEELSHSIKQIYEMIEKENQSFIDLINYNENLAESSI
ncbi:unnamed protein product [Paramecium pentaurelia]|uniref:Uncharacterized protein n=1 Tax=Paramecium pentaurelia TaxID=43138 RepID=A0A8S1YQ44_9CILI|nr:unnamed protein product [Paramecium pentaurelia]